MSSDGTRAAPESTLPSQEGVRVDTPLVPETLRYLRGTDVGEERGDQIRLMSVALDSISDFSYIFDRSGRFLYSSQPLLSLLGITLPEIVGKNFFDLNYPAELAGKLQRQIQKVFDSGQPVRDETPFTGAAGVEGFFEYIFTPVINEEGVVEHVAGSTRDISARKCAEEEREALVQELEAERAKLHYLFSNAPAFVATLLGPQHVFEMANPAYRQLAGHRELVGRAVRAAFPEVEGQGFFEILDQVYRSGQAFTGKELPIQLQSEPDGPLAERFLDFVYQPIFGTDGTVSGIFAHGTDITDQVTARRGAENANLAKDEFLATLSHELRTPLTAIMGWTTILQEGGTTPEEMGTGLGIIARNARAQGRLIEDILDVSRMITGKMRLDPQPVDLTGIIREALSNLLPAAQTKKVSLEDTLDDAEFLVSGDAARLQQVVWNLLSNALKFTPSGGWIAISLHRVGHSVELVIADSGLGISPEVLPHIFDRFRQADSTSTRAHGGLGLGLAIVRHLVELHGGTVEAASAGLGLGATFTVQFPLLQNESEAEADTGTQPPARALAQRAGRGEMPLDGLAILVVDDQEDTRFIFSMVLEKCGARVIAVESAEEALREIRRSLPDVLLSDIGMPGEDGFSLIEKVRLLPAECGGQLPAAALTAFARNEDRDRALKAGFQAHLPKPIAPADLIALVAALVGR